MIDQIEFFRFLIYMEPTHSFHLQSQDDLNDHGWLI